MTTPDRSLYHAMQNALGWKDSITGAVFAGGTTASDDVLVTRAAPRWPWGRSLHGSGQLIHRVERVAIAWRSGAPFQMSARWTCHSPWTSAPSVELLPDCDQAPVCPSCFEPAAEPVVYYAERNGLIKIGRSHQVSRRVLALGADLLATEPGDGVTEAARHAQFAAARVAGEWFKPSPALLRHIASLMEQAA